MTVPANAPPGDYTAGVVTSLVSANADAPWQPGTVQVDFTITNSGNVRLDTDATVQVAGPWGVGASTVTLDDLPEMLPGESLQRTVEITDVWPVLRANVTLQANGVAAQDGSAPVSADATDSAWAVPWMVLGLLVAGGGLIVWQRRRTEHRKQQTDDKVALAVTTDSRSPAGEIISTPIGGTTRNMSRASWICWPATASNSMPSPTT